MVPRPPDRDLASLLVEPGPPLEAAVAGLFESGGGRKLLAASSIDIALAWRLGGHPVPASIEDALGAAVEETAAGRGSVSIYGGLLARLGIKLRHIPGRSEGLPRRVPLWLHGRVRAVTANPKLEGDDVALARRACAQLFLCEFIDAVRTLAAIGGRRPLPDELKGFVDDARGYVGRLVGDLRSPELVWELTVRDAAAV